MDNIGNNVKKIRIRQGISQKNLAQGICSQSELSKIENNQILPSITLCYEISKKLNIAIDDIFSEYVEESINIQQLLELFYKKNFIECSNLVSTLHIENVEKYEQLLMYIKGGCEYHVNSEVDKSLELLNYALYITYTDFKINVTPIEIQIMNLIGIIHEEIGRKNTNSFLSKSLILMKLDLHKDIHYVAFSKCYYNFVKYYIDRNDKLEEAEKTALEGIQWCITNQTLFYLVDLIHMLLEVYNRMNKTFLVNKTKKILDSLKFMGAN